MKWGWELKSRGKRSHLNFVGQERVEDLGWVCLALEQRLGCDVLSHP